ncbi:hypothetical protein L7F22_060233 [Adiantum nelumboides]|nr:hypothetical protein [Adiantum nelumboides]
MENLRRISGFCHYASVLSVLLALSPPLSPAAATPRHDAGISATSRHDAGISATSPFEAMYAWGDSLTDTGNLLLYQRSINVEAPAGHLPFGQTFFHYPTGRFSDGRLLVDFLAQQVNAPSFLLPYLGLNGSQTNSKAPFLVNFAVGGATALNVDYLKANYNISDVIPYPLEMQIQWFSTFFISKEKEALSKALIYFGEIGVNDYNYALSNGFSTNDIITTMVPALMKVIQNSLEFLVNSGAKYLVIEGGYPIGCTPLYTRFLYTNATTDKYGCVEELQKLNEVHDKLLKEIVYNLTTKYSQDVHFIFFDQLRAYIELLKYPSHYGFTNTVDPCFDAFHLLNHTTMEACSSPSTYLSWDGIHFTEAAQSALFNLFCTRQFVTPYPNFLKSKSF